MISNNLHEHLLNMPKWALSLHPSRICDHIFPLSLFPPFLPFSPPLSLPFPPPHPLLLTPPLLDHCLSHLSLITISFRMLLFATLPFPRLRWKSDTVKIENRTSGILLHCYSVQIWKGIVSYTYWLNVCMCVVCFNINWYHLQSWIWYRVLSKCHFIYFNSI